MANNIIASGSFSDWRVNQWLKDIRTNCWVSLHFDSPVTAGAYHSEFVITPGGYSRKKVTFTNPDGRAIWNTNNLRWTGIGPNTIVYLGGWNAQVNGDLMFWERLATPEWVSSGGGWALHEGQLVISFA